MKLLCIDVGSKRIGVAVSDSLGVSAQPLVTVECASRDKAIEEIAGIAAREVVGLVVVGMPYDADGNVGEAGKKILKFIDRFKERTGLEVELWDERFSTAAVTKVLIDADVSRARRKRVVDKLAASYILQGYLDCKKAAVEV